MTKLLAPFLFIKWLRESLPSGNTVLITTTLNVTNLGLCVFQIQI